jgi:hypothetical protein
MEFGEKIGDAAETWVVKHPFMLRLLCGLALGLAALEFLDAAEAVMAVRRQACELQRAASEALGG